MIKPVIAGMIHALPTQPMGIPPDELSALEYIFDIGMDFQHSGVMALTLRPSGKSPLFTKINTF